MARGPRYVACGAIIGGVCHCRPFRYGWLARRSIRWQPPASSARRSKAWRLGRHASERRRRRPVKNTAPPRRRPTSAIGTRWSTSGKLKITIGWYIDALTVAMFCMVTLIASCIHVYSIGYMHDELHEVTDHEVTLSDGHHLHRPGRYHRFFQYLSLFSFSMLGLVISGNIGDDVRVLGTGRHLLVLPDRFLFRAEKCLECREQGVHRQSRRRFWIHHRADGAVRALGTFTFGGENGLFELVRPAATQHHIDRARLA